MTILSFHYWEAGLLLLLYTLAAYFAVSDPFWSALVLLIVGVALLRKLFLYSAGQKHHARAQNAAKVVA